VTAPNVHDFTKARDEGRDEQEDTSGGWDRVDLTDYVTGKQSTPPPTIGRRKDGACLFYRGKVNGIHGESESAKTWICLHAAADELIAGECVMYLDYEDDAAGIVGRLMALGVPGDVILARFFYRNPETAITAEALDKLKTEARDCSLIVIDATTEAMQVEGLKGRDENDVAEFHNRLSRPLAKCGAAVVIIDHVVKDEAARHLGPVGSQGKRAGITGSSVYVEVIVRMTRGSKGRSRLYVSKDRPGHVRQASTRTETGRDWWGSFAADATNPEALLVTIWPADDEEAAAKSSKGDGKRAVEETCQLIYDAIPTMKEPPSRNALFSRVGGGRTKFDQAMAILIDGDHLLIGHGARGAQLHTRGPSPYPPRPEEEVRAEDLIA
jgi:hypothetical protein